MTMPAGKFRHRVTIQSASESRDTTGELLLTWSAIERGEVWASIDPLSSTERPDSSQQQAIATHTVIIRHSNLTVTHKHRLLFGSRVFNILSVLNQDERSIFYELTCEEVAA